MYCKVNNGVIEKYNLTRKSFGVGENSSESTCSDKGYYLVVDNVPTVDTTTQRVAGSTYTIDEVTKTVVKTYSVIDIPLEELIAKKIVDGETYIKTTVKSVIDAFNTKYGVAFDSIYNMAIYKDDIDYPLATQCATLIKWQNSMWSTARANQASVLAGTMTDAEFLALLPVAPVV
jgi:predicted HTH transcriptional regulator